MGWGVGKFCFLFLMQCIEQRGEEYSKRTKNNLFSEAIKIVL